MLNTELRNKKGQFIKGCKLPEEYKRKMSEGRKGKKLSEEHVAKIVESRKGYKHSEVTREKISEAHKGKKKLPCSEETKRKISEAHKGLKFPNRKSPPPFSEEARRNMSKAQKGENHHNWKGGITPENQKIRAGIESCLWREAVFARDNWVCQKCEERGKKLHSHHIQNFAQFPELRFAIDNGITFCRNCHTEFHKKYGRENNNEEQLKEFLCQ